MALVHGEGGDQRGGVYTLRVMGHLVSHRSLPNSGPFNCPMYDVMSSSLSPCPHACREGVRGLYVLLECCKMMDNELKALSLFCLLILYPSCCLSMYVVHTALTMPTCIGRG